MKHFVFLFLVVLGFGVVGIFLDGSITGNWYRYGQNYGPEGQPIINFRSEWNWGSPSPTKLADNGPNTYVCCDSVKLAKEGLHKCPSTRKLIDKICTVSGDVAEMELFNYKAGFLRPPCPSFYEKCPLYER